MNQSAMLTKFYRDMHQWINKPWWKPYRGPFDKNYGLCTNLNKFLTYHNIDMFYGNSMFYEMKQQWLESDLDWAYPFNDRSIYSLGLLYKNPQRLAWIKDHI